MKIDKSTKISDIIKANKKAIDVIASVNSNFKKLKNPFLRKMLAPRVNIKDAAYIGGVKPGILLAKLEQIGFEIDYEITNENIEKQINNNIFTTMKKETIVKFDVRPILDGGVDPFNAIMDKLKTLDEDNETLLIINSFEPIPLLNILKKKGYTYETERPEDGTVHTFLSKADVAPKANDSVASNDVTDTFESIEKKYSGKLIEVDVRDLEMPMPMVTILENIEQLNSDEALFVHHKKLPQYLLPELQDRDCIFVSQLIDDDNVKLIIYKK